MKKHHRLIPAFLILFVGISVSIWVQLMHNKSQFNANEKEIALVIANKTDAIEKELAYSFSSVELIRHFYEQQAFISKDEFSSFTNAIFDGNSSISAISWVPKVSDIERAAFESAKRLEYNFPEFSISELDDESKTLVKASKRPYYFPVEYIEPLNQNRRALGYDIFSNNIRNSAIQKAISTKKLQITSPIKLVLDTTGYSFLALTPVYRSNLVDMESSNIDKAVGLVSSVFKVDKLVDNALIRTKNTGFELLIYDLSREGKINIYGEEAAPKQRDSFRKEIIQVGGRSWELHFIILPEFYQIKDRYHYVVFGVSLSILLFFLLIFIFIKEERTRLLDQKLYDEHIDKIKVEHSLSESQEYNRLLFNTTSIGLVLCKMNGELVDVNPAFASIIGRSIDETLKLTNCEITPEKYADLEQEQILSIEKTGLYGPFEKEYIHKDGRLIPVRLQGRIMERDGIQYIWSSVENITESKKGQVELMKNRARLQRGEITSKSGNWELNLNSKMIVASKGAEKIYGLNGEQSKYEKIKSIPLPKYRPLLDNALHNLIAKNEPYNLEFKIKNAETGDILDIHSVAEYDKELNTLFGVVQDITDRKKAEIALRESQTFNQTLLDTSPDLIYVYDIIEMKNIYSNLGIVKILGYSSDEVQKTGENLLSNLMHPDDFNNYLKNIIPRYQIAKDGEIIVQEYRMKHKNGDWCWLNSKESIFMRLENGAPKQIFGITTDITNRKKVEIELEKHHEHLEELVKERTKEIEEKNNALERMNKLFIGRELRMAELKEELKKYKRESDDK